MNERFDKEFSEALAEQTQAIMRIRPESLLESRLDLRGAATLTFAASRNDPASCAMSLSKTPQGSTLAVHVADVTEFSEPSAPLDDAALETGEGVPGRRYLFPAILISETFNFIPGEDRPALSVFLDFDSEENLVNVSFDETVIRNDHCCLFSEVDELEISGDASAVMALRARYSPFAGMIDDLYALAAKLRSERRERGGMIIPKYEPKFTFNDNARPIAFSRTAEPDSRAMLRELLIFAASALGEYCRREHYPALYNTRKAFSRPFLKKLSGAFGLDVITPDIKENEATLLCEAASGRESEPTLADELRLYMPPRVYSAQPGFNAISGTKYNVSFTKPTLRYADLVNHRIIKAIISAKRGNRVGPNAAFEKQFYDNDLRSALQQTAENAAERMSAIAAEAAQKNAEAELAERLAVMSPGSFVRGYAFDVHGGAYTILLENNLRMPYRGDISRLSLRRAADMRIVRSGEKYAVEAF